MDTVPEPSARLHRYSYIAIPKAKMSKPNSKWVQMVFLVLFCCCCNPEYEIVFPLFSKKNSKTIWNSVPLIYYMTAAFKIRVRVLFLTEYFFRVFYYFFFTEDCQNHKYIFILEHVQEAYLKPSWTSTIELFCKNS